MKLFFAQGLIQADNLPKAKATQDTLDKILTITFVTIGAIAFIMIVIAGFRYITARSDPDKITQAKNMLVYSLIGLILAASAAAIVQVILGEV